MFQLSFLNAGLLLFATATVLPLLIWLLAKKKPPQLLFSSLRFIKLSQQQEKNRTRITNIILLIIRMLIILLTVLAVARPMLAASGLGSSDKHPPTAIAIILDTSYSMDYTQDGSSMLQKASAAIQSINAQATEADRLILITRDQNWNQIHAQIYAEKIPEEALQTIGISWKPLAWDEVLSLANQKLADAQMPNSEIYLLSDFVNEEIKLKSQYPIAAISIGKDVKRRNISVSEARAMPQIVGRNRQQTLEFRLNNHSEEDRSEVLIQAVVDDIKVAEKFVSIKARQSSLETISFDLRKEGWQAGHVEVLDEALMADNRAYFAFEYFQNPKVGVVTNSHLPRSLQSILSVYAGGKDPDIIDPAQLNLQRIQGYKFMVFYDVGLLDMRLREVLNALDQQGIGALFCLSSTISPDLKAYLEQRFDISIKSYNKQSRNIDFISPHHQVTAIIADKQRKYSEVKGFWEASGGNALISAGSLPLVLSTTNSALWLWDMTGDSPFFVDPAFAVFAYRQASVLQSVNVPPNELKVGDIIRASELILPSMESIVLPNPQYLLQEPGLYTLNPGSPQAASLAVNHDYADSEANPALIEGKIKYFSDDFKHEIFMSRLGRDLWKWLLVLALILVLLEILIVKLQEAKPNIKEQS
ncbi:MAG: BatA domain-containing protein [Candidatus Cloacimonadaceae bacterium]|nr:BatA domain-containing protein [Candidatus Cloacimonadota bacterium]